MNEFDRYYQERRDKLFHESPYQRHFSDKTALTFRQKKVLAEGELEENTVKNPCKYWYHGKDCRLCDPERVDPIVLELQIKALERKLVASKHDRYCIVR